MQSPSRPDGIKPTVLAIDPGPRQSGWVLFDIEEEKVLSHGIDNNEDIITMIAPDLECWPLAGYIAIERFEARGLPLGESSIETILWSGRFAQAFNAETNWIRRRDIKLHICGTVRAKDSNVNAVLGDRFSKGQGMRVAKGTKKAPGPLYGLKSHSLAALAVAVTFTDHYEV